MKEGEPVRSAEADCVRSAAGEIEADRVRVGDHVRTGRSEVAGERVRSVGAPFEIDYCLLTYLL